MDSLHGPSSQCGQLLWTRWAQLEPDNAHVHLLTSLFAPGTAGWLEQASLARTLRSHVTVPWRVLASPALRDAEGVVKVAAVMNLVTERPTFVVMPDYRSVSDLCTTAGLRNANTAQTCDRLLKLMLDRGDDMLSLSVGVRLAERLNWPPERWQALADVRVLQPGLSAADAVQVIDMSCAGIERTRERYAAQASTGERARVQQLVHERLKTTGQTLAQAAAAERAERVLNDRRRAAEQQARASAPGPGNPVPPASLR